MLVQVSSGVETRGRPAAGAVWTAATVYLHYGQHLPFVTAGATAAGVAGHRRGDPVAGEPLPACGPPAGAGHAGGLHVACGGYVLPRGAHPQTTQEVLRCHGAHFRIEFAYRDAKQYMDLNDGQVRSQARLHFHVNIVFATLGSFSCTNASGAISRQACADALLPGRPRTEPPPRLWLPPPPPEAEPDL